MEERLQKFIASTGLCSRRAAEKLIAEGNVKVNGRTIVEMGMKINPDIDIVEYKNKRILKDQVFVYYLLHKPLRVVSTASDEKDRKSVVDCVPNKYRVYPVGRLDFMSSGLIILTNDGDLTYKLTHPKHEVTKEYIVKIKPSITMDTIKKLRSGIDIGEELTRPCKIELLEDKDDSQVYKVLLQEGKNRQIRRMFQKVDSNVIALERVAIGEIRIEKLKYGDYRVLTKDELNYLKNM